MCQRCHAGEMRIPAVSINVVVGNRPLLLIPRSRTPLSVFIFMRRRRRTSVCIIDPYRNSPGGSFNIPWKIYNVKMLFLSSLLPACFSDILIVHYHTLGVHELSSEIQRRKVNVLQVFYFTAPKSKPPPHTPFHAL